MAKITVLSGTDKSMDIDVDNGMRFIFSIFRLKHETFTHILSTPERGCI
jgi:hypothetical protein